MALHGVMGLMTRTVKIIIYHVCALAVGFMLFVRLAVVIKALNGHGVMIRRDGSMKLIVSGEKVECPYWMIDKTTLPVNLENLHATQIGTNSQIIVVRVDEHGLLYWFDGDKIGVTRCQSVLDRDVCLLLNHWLVLSEVALNQTYDVRHHMKGLKKATVVYKETADGCEYTLKYLSGTSLRELVVSLNKGELGECLVRGYKSDRCCGGDK